MTYPQKARKNQAFSLIELLVVIGVISILSVFVGMGMGGGESLRLQSAQGLLIGQIQAARNVALARNEPCRLLVEAGEAGGRRIGSVVQSASGRWEWTGAVQELPQGIAILVADGRTPTTTGGGSAAAPPIMTGDEVISSTALSGRDWHYFEFDPAGTCEANAGAILVLGAVKPTGNGHERKSDDLIRGVMIRRSGIASAFIDPAHIREAFVAL